MKCSTYGCHRQATSNGKCFFHQPQEEASSPIAPTIDDEAQAVFNLEVEEAAHDDPAPDPDPPSFDFGGGESGGGGVGGDY